MCYGRCVRCIGHSLVWLAILCIVANILLYFPNGETKYVSENHLSRFVWFFSGIVGGGLLMFLPAFMFIGLEKDDCWGCCSHENCGKRCPIFSSVLAAAIGVAGSGYCVIVAALGLAEGPLCLNSSGQWNYTFANTDGQYLLDTSSWSQCTEPTHVVEWNITLFSILLALGGIEFILCLIQIINGVMGGICGYHCSHQQVRNCVEIDMTAKRTSPRQNHNLPLFHCNLYILLVLICKTLYRCIILYIFYFYKCV
ncbi:transmembrane 4 L6 family member 1 isoform X2 [Mustela erminea]|uniref:transmembrane 4 L6 family member 1 isoform X2 n=1 Tax=Mustela erminea TaxID=36723 RepID=UPI001386E81F|nr:transmembrane 4 L6 family member 1 isoform X2 [Mustela erminea]